MRHYQAYPIGMAVIEDNDRVSVYNSDRPQTHTEEARTMDHLLQSYLSSDDGKAFFSYIHKQGKKIIPVRAGAADLGNDGIIAAILKNNLEGIIVSNYDGKSFSQRLTALAMQYSIPAEDALEYVLTHELAHAAGYDTEEGVESILSSYFTDRAHSTQDPAKQQKYFSLQKLADSRKEYAKQQDSHAYSKVPSSSSNVRLSTSSPN